MLCFVNSTFDLLRQVLNAEVHLIASLGPHDHVTEQMMELHWLHIRQLISFKLCLMMHVAVYSQCPSYIHDIIMPLSTLPGRSRLGASATGLFNFPRTRTALGNDHSSWLVHASGTLFRQILAILTIERVLNEL